MSNALKGQSRWCEMRRNVVVGGARTRLNRETAVGKGDGSEKSIASASRRSNAWSRNAQMPNSARTHGDGEDEETEERNRKR